MKNYILTFETKNDAEKFFNMLDGKHNQDIKMSSKNKISVKLGYNPAEVESYMKNHKIVKAG